MGKEAWRWWAGKKEKCIGLVVGVLVEVWAVKKKSEVGMVVTMWTTDLNG